jgi:IS5 family transposase
VQGYNCQLAVDSASQIIVAHATLNEQCDTPQLPAIVRQIKINTGRQAQELSADAGYLSEANLRELKRRHIRAYIATGRQRHSATATPPPKRGPNTGPLTVLMNQRLRRGGWRSRYRLRKVVVEPVIGQIKQNRGYRTFLLRGLKKVRLEWGLVCTAHNLAKLAARQG